MSVLVTGATGFVASHMLEHISRVAPELPRFGLVRPGLANGLPSDSGVTAIEADLTEPAAVRAAVAQARPERVLHLAALSSVHASWRDPAACFATNVLGLGNLLEALREASLQPRVLVVGSADEYGAVAAEELPLGEDAPPRPRSPYAASKVAQGYLARRYARTFDMDVVCTRTFPHTGPGRGELFAESSFARQIAEIEAGVAPAVVRAGNLDAVRDFSDVRDVVRAYWSLLERGEPGGTYNVCSGHGVSLHEILDTLLELSGTDVAREVDRERLRPADLPALIGDPGRLRAATGWTPEIPLRETLRDLLEHWRERVREGTATRSRR